jgi:deoxycytidylate deaminase
MECALKIIEHGGVTKVVYDALYPSPVYQCKEALELLKNHGIDVEI